MRDTPAHEERLRLAALEQYDLVEALSGTAVRDLTALAASLCESPIAAISILHPEATHFYARVGSGPTHLARGRLPCEQCIQSGEVYEITDARYHEAFRPDGIMVGGRAFRFYAGAPLITPSGIAIGTLFVQNSAPHTLTANQKTGLLTLARQVMNCLELSRRMRHIDRDVRARERVESALKVERNFVSTVLDTVDALVAVFDTAGRIVRFNRTCEQVSGFEFSSLVGRYVWESLIPPEDIPHSIENFERLCNGDFPARFENCWRNRDGTLRRIAWSATALVDAQGQTTFVIATGIDITSQRESEVTLRESEARYRQLIEGSLGMVCTHDVNGVLTSVNKHGAENLGHTAEEMIGRNLISFIPESQQPSFIAYLNEILKAGEAQGRMQISDRHGLVRTIAFRNKLIEAPEREPYVLGFGIDITEQIRAKNTLRALMHQSDSILDSVGDGIIGIDLAGLVTIINPAAAQMLGYKPHELLGRKLHALIHHTRADGTPYPIHECRVNDTLRDLDTVRVLDEVFWRKDGTSFPVEYVARPQIDAKDAKDPKDVKQAQPPGSTDLKPSRRSGRAVGVVIAFTDTTERRALDRMKDEFISTISHELRTPLTSLRAALGLITGGALAARPEKLHQMLEIAIENTDRLIRLVNDILEIERLNSGHAELHATMCSARTLLERAVSLQQGAADKQALHFSIFAEEVEIWADPDRIVQALSNLLSNAIKFSSPGGEISLSARRVDASEAQFDVHDHGRGIPADKLEHIFKRFEQVDASDSRVIGGTGLGLTICRSIINQHGGRIWASSPPDDGATFHFTLPTQASARLATIPR